jgi:hypothetical protein
MRLILLSLVVLVGASARDSTDQHAIRAARSRFNLAIERPDTVAIAADWAEEIQIISSRGEAGAWEGRWTDPGGREVRGRYYRRPL